MTRRQARRNDRRGLARRGPTRQPLPLILVVCEGRVTEPGYLDGFRREMGATNVRVHIHSPGGDPLALVQRAHALATEADEKARRDGDDGPRYDEVWCVLDVDAHQRLDKARRFAAEKGIELAISNPCFELWLLLHFADHTAHLKPRQAAAFLQTHLRGYDKHVAYADLHPGYATAVARAEALEKRHAEAGKDGCNPSTGVHRLTERIRQLGKAARL